MYGRRNEDFDRRRAAESMVWAIRSRAAEFFEPTVPNDYLEFQKGLYAVYYGKPSKRVSRLLGIEREVLILATSFNDLQARAVQFAIDLIDKTKGRLETNFAVIAHRDASGNGKLKNWGRDLDLRVIPLYMPDFDLPTGDALEKMLFLEFFSHDPFDVSGPVSDDNHFYGRRDEAQELARQLQAGQVRACLGIRKIGKTSVIHRVLDLTEDYSTMRAVVVDCSRDDIWAMNAAQLLTAVGHGFRTAESACERRSEAVAVTDVTEVAPAAGALREALSEGSEPALLVFDEVDYITPGSPTAHHWRVEFNPFWRNLRAVYQQIARSKRPLSVLVSGVSSKWFREEQIDGIENAALAFIPEEYLTPLHRAASVAMIQSIARTSGLIVDTEGANHLAEACSDIPFWIRKAGSYIHRNLAIDSRPFQPDPAEIGGLVDAFVEYEGGALADVALSHLFRVYPELSSVAELCFAGKGAEAPAHLRNVLCKYGVARRHAGADNVIGDMMRAGMELYLARTKEASHSDAPGIDARLAYASIDEWAEELSLINRHRNKLEVTLRGIVVNFLRFDSLQNRQKAALVERLLKVVDEKRAHRFRQLSPEEIAEKYLWSEMVSLILREWSVFASVFADKALFTLHANILNARYDAHAKPADKADIAHYRRSLTWFDEALARPS
jgi:hypothetical protein